VSIPPSVIRRDDDGQHSVWPNRQEASEMRYAILIYDTETANPSPEPPDPTVQGEVMGAYNGYTKMLRDRGANLAGEALQPNPTATTLRQKDGQTITTDGPFAETKEGLGGFYMIEAPDLDVALELAAQCPGIRYGAIEVRPIWETGTGVAEDQSVGAAAG
jgi:hypothetical protein